MSILDSWSGETVERDGRRYFVMPDGTLQPVIAGGGAQGWEELIDVLTADGTAMTGTTEAIVCPDLNIPAYYMAPGRTLRVTAYGVVSNIATTPGTLTLKLRWGGVAGTPVLLQSAAQSLDTAAHTNALWRWQSETMCRTAGAAGTMMSGGILSIYNVLPGAAANSPLLPALLGTAGTPGASGNAVATGADTTLAKLLSLTAVWSIANAGNTITCQQRLIEVLN